MHWHLPTEGAKTINGLIIEHMETIPEVGTTALVDGYPIEVVQTSPSAVKTVRIDPTYRQRVRAKPL
jgi:Mg2+/Co2+ transporter CorB